MQANNLLLSNNCVGLMERIFEKHQDTKALDIKYEFVCWEADVKYPSKIFKLTRVDNKRNIKAMKVIVVEGHQSMRIPKLLALADLKIYEKGKDTASKGSFRGSFGVSKKKGSKRVKQDLKIYWPAVKEGEEKTIIPYKKYADLTFNNAPGRN
ncbi:hypothetical protein G9A89_002642 [Geosiphon pyriformis]|nr:hypothetical protein G9A89_002642 [Geosiphon pyriformis]